MAPAFVIVEQIFLQTEKIIVASYFVTRQDLFVLSQAL